MGTSWEFYGDFKGNFGEFRGIIDVICFKC